jgi:hypothetical protein
VLKKTPLKPHQTECWCIRPKENAAFVATMEDVREVEVMDNLNTHTIASLYQSFAAEEAFEIAQKPEIHYTPKHGSLTPNSAQFR